MTAPVQVDPLPQGGGPGPFSDLADRLADLGDRVRAERRARGWSQDELGRRAGLNGKAVRALEAGRPALLGTFVRACDALGVDVGHLLSDRWRMPVRNPLSPLQRAVLAEAASGDSLAEIGSRMGMTRTEVGSVLTRVYQRLEVTHVARGERRAAAVRAVARFTQTAPKTGTS